MAGRVTRWRHLPVPAGRGGAGEDDETCLPVKQDGIYRLVCYATMQVGYVALHCGTQEKYLIGLVIVK